MESHKKSDPVEGQAIGLLIFECVMACLYLLFGVLFLFTPLFGGAIHGWVRTALGILFGLYGVFRIFRAVRKVSSRIK